jgi:hypothetical protein
MQRSEKELMMQEREGDDMKSKGNSCVLRESLCVVGGRGRGTFLNELVKNGGRNTFEVGWLENNKRV